LILAEWNSGFKEVFGKDKSYWKTRGDLLAKVRTRLAHNRDRSIRDFERRSAQLYCEEILERIKASYPGMAPRIVDNTAAGRSEPVN
jgi:hypothetical protein